MWSCDDQGEGAQIHRWHTVRCNDGITRPVYIMEGNLGDIYHDWTHTNTEQDARRRVDGERRIDMMAELVMSLWPYSGRPAAGPRREYQQGGADECH